MGSREARGSQVGKFIGRLRRKALDTASYWKLNLSGNRVQRLTDFRSCEKPVLLIYGYAATRRILTVLEKRLRKDGYCVFSLRLGGLFDTFNIGGIIKSAQVVADKINKLRSLYDLGPITIIGHSKGGLIGEYYLKFLGGAEHARGLITLATPHRGTPWALLGVASPLGLVSTSIRQMWPGSPFLRKLSETKLKDDIHFVSIYSRSDGVCPYPFCKVDLDHQPNAKNIEIHDINHSQFVMSRRAYEVIRREVEMGFRRDSQSEHTGETTLEITEETTETPENQKPELAAQR